MSRKTASATLLATLLASTALADAPNVATDIAPVHSLVAQVMQGVGSPTLVIAPGASPHAYSLRPSEAAALQEAELIFWVSADLTPWLKDAIGTLSKDAVITELLESDGTIEIEKRAGANFEVHKHDDHIDHDEHDKHEENGHSDHADHAHGDTDPHAWLSPDNAATWLTNIATRLSAADPDNADTYFANAAAAREKLQITRAEISATLEPVRGKSFIVFHDAYQYFEQAFDFPSAGAISLSDANKPSPARIAEIRDIVQHQNVTCVMAEPQYNPGIVQIVADGAGVVTSVLDPLGSHLDAGPELYGDVLKGMAKALAECLSR